jgi:enamine deaminase RidA (YjgF/YER057c/UK114 family)
MSRIRNASETIPSAALVHEPQSKSSAHTILQPSGWPRPKGYSNGLLAEGRIIVTGGVIGWDRDGVIPPTFVGQAKQLFQNIAAILAEAGAGPEHLVRLTWYVTDIDEYLAEPKELGAAYRSVFGRNFPAMATVQVMRLIEPAAKIEIEAMAVLPVSADQR